MKIFLKDIKTGLLIKASGDRKSTRLNSSHSQISYAVFCLKKKQRRVVAGHHRARRHDGVALRFEELQERLADVGSFHPSILCERRLRRGTALARSTEMRPTDRAPLSIADGTLEALKWLALALMVLDHVNSFLFTRTLPGAFQAGRSVFPLFAFVLAGNLARPGALQRGVHVRVMRRLALFALLATPAHWALVGHWWPLNILVTLLAGTATVYGLERADAPGVAIAGIAFAAGGHVRDAL